MKRKVLIALAGMLALLVLALLGGGVFLYSGLYDISADRPHTNLERAVLTFTKRRSISQRAAALEGALPEDPAALQRGLVLYRARCLVCHGAPGEARGAAGTGMNPNPPPLEIAAERWTAEEIFWITKHGIKLAGMPAFGLTEEDSDLWALTAFVVRMNTLSPAEYAELRAVAEGGAPASAAAVPWIAPDQGWRALSERADPARGRELLGAYGCGACHVIPGVERAEGQVGPPLSRWETRHYVAGRVVNTPVHLVQWIVDPRSIKRATAMPDLGVTEDEAWAMSAYLYTLE